MFMADKRTKGGKSFAIHFTSQEALGWQIRIMRKSNYLILSTRWRDQFLPVEFYLRNESIQEMWNDKARN